MNISSVNIIGSGTMGLGIAQWFCQQGVPVFLVDRDRSIVESAKAKMHEGLSALAAKGKFTSEEVDKILSQLQVGLLEEIPTHAPLVIEAVFEDLHLKQELFSRLDALMDDDCLLATNTSSFLIRELGARLPLSRRRRFLGLHFFNPATLMKLVEVAMGPETDARHAQALSQWFEARGKAPVRCQDSPGMIVNRLARNFYGEALRIAESESVTHVDQIMRQVGGFKMGPFELLDLIGLDVNLEVTRSVWKAFGQAPRFAPHPIQEEKVRQGHWGRKSKKGFYDYP